ncbi:pyridoxamine 5'-phosphate oxidase family protein [Roseomonas fluvialis]|uniref:Pyridoxamine 5'-phosphate oxidase n=1 Tax=Roseomonas fluvialis TaxID=1750527 RepID=A0ABM9SEB1_9PROT|nr:pyridoxamine 5'-phosphate oxidase family protein [Roseomonas fluvialis]BDG73657.1 pyridoxamine 5'-phosphate oxidase [Roseomonas fluvialis]
MRIETITELEALYGAPVLAATAKVADRITPDYRRLIDASPFLVLATAGPEGLDASPRGDAHGLVRIDGDRTLLLPDRRGNNRVDSLRNIIRDPRVGLLFLIPGAGTTLRVNGRAHLSVAPGLLESFAVDGAPPRCVVVIEVQEVYFQCARAILRAGLWDATRHADPASLPTPGAILAAMSAGAAGGDAYDRDWPARAAKTMW